MVGQTESHANVDFAYTGPPVVVSNGQALDLVRQFGVQNAWYAYLKLRGMNLSKEEAEKAVALKKFRNKIRRLKKVADSLKERREDFDGFLSKEFSTFLEPNSLELKRDEGSGSEESDGKEDSPMQGENGGDTPTTSNIPAIFHSSLPGLQIFQSASSSMIAGDTNMSLAGANQKLQVTSAPENPEKKRHQETIDDVVSSIMDKIRNNLPFEGELTSSSASTQPPASRAPKKSKNTKKGNEAVFVPSATTTAADQVAIFSNFSDIIRASTSKQASQELPIPTAPTHFPTAFTVPFASMNLSAITGQGISLPNNLTVQALLQSIQQQAKKAQMLQQQETLPDSSSQDTVLQHQDPRPQTSSTAAPLASPPAQPTKKREPARKKKPEKMSLTEAANKVDAKPAMDEVKEEVANTSISEKKPKGKKPAKTEDLVKAEPKPSEEGLKRIAELESQLNKCQKQLATEKNKFGNQKKRLEKLQSDLEKNIDAVQLLQIDLACQKTDNNNLTAENIALKAENQQLKSKDTSSKSSVASKSKKKSGETSVSTKPTKSATAKRGRKARTPSPANQKMDSIAEPAEYGRRQSKRICVSRSRFLYGLI